MNKETFEKAKELATFIKESKFYLDRLAPVDDIDFCPRAEINGVWIDGKYIKLALILQREDLRLKLKTAEAELAEL